MKNRHNKKKNTSFLFEVLIREISGALSQKDIEKAKVGKNLLKSFFCKGSVLQRELSLYEEVMSSRGVLKDDAISILMEIKNRRAEISNELIEKEQIHLAGKIRKNLGKKVFENFVPNYKMLATLNQIFVNKIPVKQKIHLEKQTVDFMTSKEPEKNVLEPIDNIVMKSFAQKFNEKFSTLAENQKLLLGKFASSFDGNDADFLMFLDKEVKSIKEKLGNALKEKKDLKENEFLCEKLEEVLLEIEKFKERSPDEMMIRKILKAQSIVSEIENE